jgi:uncharacterized protein (TIGR03067 family)
MPRSLKCLLILGIAIPSLAGVAGPEQMPKDAAIKEDVRKLQGAWVVKSYLIDGDAMENKIEVAFRGKNFEMRFEPRWEGEACVVEFSFELDTSKDPKQIRKTIVSHVNAGKSWKGIYRLTGDILETCFQIDEKLWNVPPKKFDGKKGSQQILMKLERVDKVALARP